MGVRKRPHVVDTLGHENIGTNVVFETFVSDFWQLYVNTKKKCRDGQATSQYNTSKVGDKEWRHMIALVNLLFAVQSYLSPDGVFDVDDLFVQYDILQNVFR